MGRNAAAIAAFGALLACGGAALVLLVASAAPMPAGAELGGMGRAGLRISNVLRQAWYALPCPAAAVGVLALMLVPFGRRAPLWCGYAVAGAGALVFVVSSVLAGLTLSAR
jgi:hypothetical protein